MRIISHRGYWKTDAEKNSAVAFRRSFSLGFGTETDVRDYNGELVISHDIATSASLPFEEFLRIYVDESSHPNLPLALNVKADGLQEKLRLLLEKYRITSYFMFDMSTPQHIQYAKQGFVTFTRISEYEPVPVLYDESAGVWVDCFIKEWVTCEVIREHLQKGKCVALVSPDLHKRDHLPFWRRLATMDVIGDDAIILCTDLPEDAQRFFHEKD